MFMNIEIVIMNEDRDKPGPVMPPTESDFWRRYHEDQKAELEEVRRSQWSTSVAKWMLWILILVLLGVN